MEEDSEITGTLKKNLAFPKSFHWALMVTLIAHYSHKNGKVGRQFNKSPVGVCSIPSKVKMQAIKFSV